MFGLMRAKKCGMTDAEKDFRRLNYCGTCKTIGSLYGQKSRVLLNHDTVFLAEILTALSDENVASWGKSYQSYNCLSLPKSEMPLSLRFAATTNLFLTEFKLADHVADEKKRRYEFAQKSFSKEFKRAENTLESWNFPLAEVKTILQSQNSREKSAVGKNIEEILENLAAPTVDTTAIFFAEGAKIVGKSDAANQMRELGAAFGKLVYLLDAFEDYAKDYSKNQFNAIRAAFDLNEKRISSAAKRKTISILRALENEIGDKIRHLPINENQKIIFVARLSENLERKLKTSLPVARAKNVCAPKTRKTFVQKWRDAAEKAGNPARGFSWQMPLVFAFVFTLALVAPAQTREAKSAREYFDLSLNLMFLGAVFGALLSAPMVAMQNLAPEKVAEKIEKKRREGWCDSCDCPDCCACCDCAECCCKCDGCCDSCDCCSCDS
jgi:hypothetical protein